MFELFCLLCDLKKRPNRTLYELREYVRGIGSVLGEWVPLVLASPTWKEWADLIRRAARQFEPAKFGEAVGLSLVHGLYDAATNLADRLAELNSEPK